MTGAGRSASKLDRYLAWFAEAQLVGWTVLGLLAAVFTMVCHAANEPSFCLAGLWLQLMGVAMTALGFYRTRLFFEKPRMLEKLSQWWRRAPWKPRSAVVGGGSVILGSSLVSGHATASMSPEATTDERLIWLEQSMALLHRVFWEEQQRTREMKTTLEREIAAERRAREEGHQRTDERLKEAQTGGLGEAIVGLIWVAVGTVLGGASNELSWLLG